MPSDRIGRAFAMVELLRSEAAFLLAPVLVVLAMHTRGLAGIRLGLLVAVVVGAVGLTAVVAVYLVSGARPAQPDLVEWLDHDGQALDSPPILG